MATFHNLWSQFKTSENQPFMLGVAALQQQFEDYLQANRFNQKPTTLYEPANYIMALGGKRMRPVMALLAYQIFDPQVENALPAAMSVEIFHNFSLVHDDIMDEAAVRRGQPTVHARYGTNSGILSGDVMLVYAFDYLQRTVNKSAISDMVATLCKVAIKVCEGQQYDVDFEKRPDVSLDEYLQMIEMKTAVLLAGSLELGALAAGADAENRHHLAEFGRLTGIAFQIQDDYLDTFGDNAKVGKRIGGDIVQNKKTCLYIQALACAEADTRAQLLAYFGTQPDDPTEKVAAVTDIFQSLGIPAFLKDLRNSYQTQAYDHLAKVQGNEAAKQLLYELAESLLVREL
jgi:geranylgeranyl diphosphate synthase type II